LRVVRAKELSSSAAGHAASSSPHLRFLASAWLVSKKINQ